MSTSTKQIKEEVQVQTATEIPVALLNRFYERMYPSKAPFLSRHWRWLYRVGTYEAIPSPLVAMLDDQVIGHAGLIPVTLRRSGEERTAIWFVDFWVLPEYQRKGIGVALTKRWMASCPLHITFCNERSIGVFLKYNWEARFHTTSFKLYLRPERHPRFQEAPTKIIAALAGLATRIVWQARTFGGRELAVAPATRNSFGGFTNIDVKSSALHVPRSAEFLQWRVETHPHANEYLVFDFESRRNEKYSAIARVFEDAGYRRLHLLALRGEMQNKRALSDFFASIVHWAVKKEVHEIWFVASDPATAQMAKWWFPVSNRARFACHANDDSGKEFLSGTNHFWECLDSDFDLAYY